MLIICFLLHIVFHLFTFSGNLPTVWLKSFNLGRLTTRLPALYIHSTRIRHTNIYSRSFKIFLFYFAHISGSLNKWKCSWDVWCPIFEGDIFLTAQVVSNSWWIFKCSWQCALYLSFWLCQWRYNKYYFYTSGSWEGFYRDYCGPVHFLLFRWLLSDIFVLCVDCGILLPFIGFLHQNVTDQKIWWSSSFEGGW